jgi:hypothetical protein
MNASIRRTFGTPRAGLARARSTGLALLVAAIAGCATSAPRPPSVVSESDFARLPDDKSQRVDVARQRLGDASDELGRAKLGVVNDQHEGALARSDQAAASADLGRAAAETKVGKDSNEPGQKQLASDDTKDAKAGKAVADAHLAYAKKLATSRAAAVTAAERKVELRSEEVNLAKLQSLEEAGIPAAGKYDRAGALERVAKAQKAFDAATVAAARAEAETAAAMSSWHPVTK